MFPYDSEVDAILKRTSKELPEEPSERLHALVERTAREFHETYESLAPNFGYETRAETRRSWEELPDTHNNKRLMIATVEALVTRGVIKLTDM